MSRKYCQNRKTWINNLSYCAYYRNILCQQPPAESWGVIGDLDD